MMTGSVVYLRLPYEIISLPVLGSSGSLLQMIAFLRCIEGLDIGYRASTQPWRSLRSCIGILGSWAYPNWGLGRCLCPALGTCCLLKFLYLLNSRTKTPLVVNDVANAFEDLVQPDVMGLYRDPYFKQFLTYISNFRPKFTLFLGYLPNHFGGLWVQHDLCALCFFS